MSKQFLKVSFDISDCPEWDSQMNKIDNLWSMINEYSVDILNGELISISKLKGDEVSFNVKINELIENHTVDRSEIRNYKINKIL